MELAKRRGTGTATPERRGSTLSHVPNVACRATLTADIHGGIISANAACLDFFGYDPADLIDTSCRHMLQLLPQKRRLLQAQSDRFSKTDMWKDVMQDLTSVRVVNGKHKDGSLIPMLLTSSAISLQGLQLYALLFERIPEHTAIITTDFDGLIQSATSNISSVIRINARELCGKQISEVIPPADGESNYLMASIQDKTGKHVIGNLIDLVVPTALGPTPVRLQVIDAQHNMLVVTIRKRSVRLQRGSGDSLNVGNSSSEFSVPPLDKDAAREVKEVGYYTVLGDLGVGQCGVVRKALHRTSGVETAIKTLSKAKFDEIGLKWGTRELELMRFLNHPNIVHLYDCISGDDVSYLIMEFVDGGELLGYCCEKGALPEDEARGFFRDILGAVDYLHRKGIVHRDLKLENCLLDSQKRVKIIDFGLANFYLKGMLKTSCGSADYAAPELFASMKYFGPPVDVWAMGVMLFAMLAGVFPFEEVQATLDGDYGWPAEVGVSDSVKYLVKDIFVLNPDLRLTIEQIRRHDWVNQGYKQPPARPAISIKPSDNNGDEVKRDVWTFRLDILIQMEHTFGFAIEAVVESLLNEDINQLTATYKMLVTKYPDEMKAVVSDPNTAVYTDSQRHAAAKAIIQQAHKRRERGAALDLVQLRSNLRDRTQSESLDQRPAEIDEIMRRRASGSVRRGSVAVPTLEGIGTSAAQTLTGPPPPPGARSARLSGSANDMPKAVKNDGSKTAREKPTIRAIFEKRFSGQKKDLKDNEYTPEFSPSVSKKQDMTPEALSLSPPASRPRVAMKKTSLVTSGEQHFDNDLSHTPPAITGGLLGSFWKQKKKQDRVKPKARKKSTETSSEGSPAISKGRKNSAEPKVNRQSAEELSSATSPKREASSIQIGRRHVATQQLSPTPNALNRATVTADDSGHIISANAAVQSVFGYDPAELVDKSCRMLIQLLARKRKSGSNKIEARTSSEGFSQSDVWRCVLSELTMARVVNAKHKDGSLVPVLLTSTTLNVGGLQLYALLFENLPKNSAVVTCDADGVVQSATQNVVNILHCATRDICGQPLTRFVRGPQNVFLASLDASKAARYGKEAKHHVGSQVDVFGVPRQIGGPGIPLLLQVMDTRDDMYVVSIRPRDGMRRPVQEVDQASVAAAAVDMSAKNGVSQAGAALVEEDIGYYTVSGALGVGQCGLVRRGIHRPTGVEVAVKTLDKNVFVEANLSWPGREVELMKYLNHPNIVQLFDCVVTPNRMYLIMALVTGGELLSFCFDSGPLPEVKARQFFRDILGAVDYLHRKGIVHRDLKLENCLLDEQRKVKLIDFGLANFYLNGPLTTSCGSADYAAPELFTTAKYYGPPVDVWAVGAMLYAMIVGKFPFENVRATIDGDYYWPEEKTYSEPLKNMLGMMFELNPDLRLTVEQIRRHDWVNVGFRGPPDRPAILSSSSGVSAGVRRDVLALRADILLKMEEVYGLNIEASLQSVLTEQTSLMTATYKMLINRYPKPLAFDPASTNPMASKFANPERLAPVEAMIKEGVKRVERGILMDLVLMRNSVRERTSPRSNRDSSGNVRTSSIVTPQAPDAAQDAVTRRERPSSVVVPNRAVAGGVLSNSALVPALRNLQDAASRLSPYGTRERSNSKSANSTPREVMVVDTGATDVPKSSSTDDLLSSEATGAGGGGGGGGGGASGGTMNGGARAPESGAISGGAQKLLRQYRERSQSRDEGVATQPPPLPAASSSPAIIRMGARRNSTLRK